MLLPLGQGTEYASEWYLFFKPDTSSHANKLQGRRPKYGLVARNVPQIVKDALEEPMSSTNHLQRTYIYGMHSRLPVPPKENQTPR